MTRLIPLIESGQVVSESGFVEIHRSGVVFSFTMDLWTDWILSYVPDPQVEFNADGRGGHPNACSLRVKLITPNGDIEVGHYSFQQEISSALRIAHDFAVMRALIDGKPESEILAMKPFRQPLARGLCPAADIIIAKLEANASGQVIPEAPKVEKSVLH
jgi:hypothetical protein